MMIPNSRQSDQAFETDSHWRSGRHGHWQPQAPGYNPDMTARPRIVFDTTGINELEKGGPASEPLMRVLECGYEVILTAMSAGEIISTNSATRREALLSRFGKLLYSAKCLWPRTRLSDCRSPITSEILQDSTGLQWT